MVRLRYIWVVAALAGACTRQAVVREAPTDLSRSGCLGEIKPAIIVEIRDARNGSPLAYLARGVVQDGSYSDSLAPSSWESREPQTMYARRAANERPGIYDVRVERVGYQPWNARGVRVGADHCGVRTVTLHARLVVE